RRPSRRERFPQRSSCPPSAQLRESSYIISGRCNAESWHSDPFPLIWDQVPKRSYCGHGGHSLNRGRHPSPTGRAVMNGKSSTTALAAVMAALVVCAPVAQADPGDKAAAEQAVTTAYNTKQP